VISAIEGADVTIDQPAKGRIARRLQFFDRDVQRRTAPATVVAYGLVRVRRKTTQRHVPAGEESDTLCATGLA